MKGDEAPPRGWLLLGLCVLLVACVYARTLDGAFIWDDRYLTEEAGRLLLSPLAQAFQQPFWLGPPGEPGSHAYYRPLSSLSFMLDAAVHGENPSGFHLTNLLFHLVTTGLLFGLLRRRGNSDKTAFLLASAWALLPRLTEGAAWISGRGDVLAALCCLLALWVHRPGVRARLIGAMAIGFAALLCKESGVAVLVALFLLERSAAAATRSSSRAALLVLSVPAVGYLLLRLSAGATSVAEGIKLGFGARLLTGLEALGRYAFMLLDPLQPRSFFGQLGQTDYLFVALGVVVLGGLIFLATRWRRLSGETRALLVLGLVPLGLVLHLTAALPVEFVAADRYLYLPSAALLLAAAPAVERWLSARPAHAMALLVLTLALGVRTYQRVGDYSDDARFFVTAARATPSSGTALLELGAVAYRAGLFAQGLALSQRAIPLDVYATGRALDNAALMAMASGDRKLAAELGDELVSRHPSRAPYQLRRAAIALNARDLPRAEQHARRALQLAPAFEQAQNLLQVVERTRALLTSVNRPAALEQDLDLEAARFPEVIARLERLLAEPGGDRATLERGVQSIVVAAQPEHAKALLAAYRARFGEASQLESALALRVERAAEVQAQLDELRGASN